LLAEVISKELNITLSNKSLIRQKHTPPQSSLTKAQRESNLKEAFVADSTSVKGKSVLLIDDVLTTGTTIDECAKVLKISGAKSITAIVVATGRKL
jgi:predicted amidophosphoribosyltransferase